MLTVYKVSRRDRHVVDEFRKTPVGQHSPELQRVLNVFRGEAVQDKYVLVCTKPAQEWVLGQLTGERGKPIKILKDKVFKSLEDAEWEVFQRRWKKHTGSNLG